MSATLRALLCITSVAASMEWRRIAVPRPSQYSLAPSDGAGLTIASSSDKRQRYRTAEDSTWNTMPREFRADFCWDRKCLSFRDGRNPIILQKGGTKVTETFGGIAQATSGTLLWRARPYRSGRLLLAGYHTARYGQAIFLGLDTVTASGDSTLAWRRIRSPAPDSTLDYSVRLIGNRIYFALDQALDGSTSNKISWSADSGRTWSDLGFEARALEGWKDTIIAVTSGFHLAVSTDGGRSWDSTVNAPREPADYKVLAGRLWMAPYSLRRVAWSTDLGRSWIECPGLAELPQFDGTLLQAEGDSGLLVSDPKEIRWKPQSGQYAVDALVDLHPFADGYLATTTMPNWSTVFRLIQRSRGGWTTIDERTKVFHAGRSEVLAWRTTGNGGTVVERSTDARNWHRVDTLGSYWQEWYIGSDEKGRFSLHDGNGLRVSVDGGVSWARHLPEIKGLYADDYCHPDGFDGQGRPLCELDQTRYRYEAGSWHLLPDTIDMSPFGIHAEYGSRARRNGDRYFVHRYRDSLLVTSDTSAWVVWADGHRKLGHNGEPAGVRFAAWVPGGGLADADSVLLVQDTAGSLWEGRDPAITRIGLEVKRKSRIRLEGNALVIDLEAPSRLRVEAIDLRGRTETLLPDVQRPAGELRLPLKASTRSVQWIRVVVDGRNSTITAPPSLMRR